MQERKRKLISREERGGIERREKREIYTSQRGGGAGDALSAGARRNHARNDDHPTWRILQLCGQPLLEHTGWRAMQPSSPPSRPPRQKRID